MPVLARSIGAIDARRRLFRQMLRAVARCTRCATIGSTVNHRESARFRAFRVDAHEARTAVWALALSGKQMCRSEPFPAHSRDTIGVVDGPQIQTCDAAGASPKTALNRPTLEA